MKHRVWDFNAAPEVRAEDLGLNVEILASSVDGCWDVMELN